MESERQQSWSALKRRHAAFAAPFLKCYFIWTVTRRWESISRLTGTGERMYDSCLAHHSQRRSYAVYPPHFHERGVCWTFRVISRARSKAKSLGIGTWIRRYVDTVDKNTGKRLWQIERLWLWNGVRFVRLREEPTMLTREEQDQLVDVLAQLDAALDVR